LLFLVLSLFVERSLLCGEEVLFPEKLLVKLLRIPPVTPDLYILLPTEERVVSAFLVLLFLALLVLLTVERVLLERIFDVLSLYWQS
jgi:hypothetical protein